MRPYIAPLLLALTLSSPAVADETQEPTTMLVPVECTQYWKIPGGKDSPVAWSHVLSFAQCIQDNSVADLEDPSQIPLLVMALEREMAQSLRYYAAAIQHGPSSIQVRAVYQIGMSQVALITRARLSIARLASKPAYRKHYAELRAQLEPTLVEPAKLAWTAFALIDQVVAEDPSMAPDVVTKNMVKSARQLAAILAREWSFEEEQPDQHMLAL